MIRAYAAHDKSQPLEEFNYEPAEMGAYDLDVKITHCGVCHSDVHLIDADWGRMEYPLVPGHEVIGEVVAVGSAVDQSMIGKRVGIGWQNSSCLECDQCTTNNEQLCDDAGMTCWGNYGGFAEGMRVDSRFCHVIPDSLASENAAPLLCAGVTVFSPLRRTNVTNGMRVGVVGIGGLGHLALQYANKMGADVTAFSSSDAKRDQAQELGAHNYINSRDANAMKSARKSLDVIVVTATADLNWLEYVKSLRPNGTLMFVNAPTKPMSLPLGFLIERQLNVTGSSIGSRAMMREMLEFSANNDIQTWTEAMPLDGVNTAIERLRKNDVRYRFVLEA